MCRLYSLSFFQEGVTWLLCSGFFLSAVFYLSEEYTLVEFKAWWKVTCET